MTSFDKAKQEAAEKWWVQGDKHSSISFKYGADWGYAFAKSEDREATGELVKALEIIQKGPEIPLTRDMLSAKSRAEYVAMFSQSVAREAIAKYRAKDGEG